MLKSEPKRSAKKIRSLRGASAKLSFLVAIDGTPLARTCHRVDGKSGSRERPACLTSSGRAPASLARLSGARLGATGAHTLRGCSVETEAVPPARASLASAHRECAA